MNQHLYAALLFGGIAVLAVAWKIYIHFRLKRLVEAAEKDFSLVGDRGLNFDETEAVIFSNTVRVFDCNTYLCGFSKDSGASARKGTLRWRVYRLYQRTRFPARYFEEGGLDE